MKNPTFISELHKKLGAPTSELVDSLRLLKAFVKLAPPQRYEVLEMAERLANDDSPSSEHPLSLRVGCRPESATAGWHYFSRREQLDARSRWGSIAAGRNA